MNVEERLEEQQKEMNALKTKVQVLEAGNAQLAEEKKVQEEKCCKLDKDIASLEKKYQNEIEELKGKLTAQNEAFEEKLKKLEEMINGNTQKISGIENEIMVQIHEMKVQLQVETWHDLLALVPRRQLGNAVAQIGDRQFADILQPFLHERGQITLVEMSTGPPLLCTDQPLVHVKPNRTTNMPAEGPMPGNIINFKEIKLDYVDAYVLHFLRKFQQNSLLTDVNMYCTSSLNEGDVLPLMTKFAPSIASIDSIDSIKIDLIKLAYNNNNNNNNNTVRGSRLLLKEMMEKTRILTTNWFGYGSDCSWEDKMDWFCSWLYTPRTDGKPRMLRLCITNLPYARVSFIERIKQDFKIASHAVSFFIYTIIRIDDNFEDISFDNVKRNEKLVIKKVNRYGNSIKEIMLMIGRYPLTAANNWIEANEKEIAEWNGAELDRKIVLNAGLTIDI